MMSVLHCPHCNGPMQVPVAIMGKVVRCPRCSGIVPTAAPSNREGIVSADRVEQLPAASAQSHAKTSEVRPGGVEPAREKAPARLSKLGLFCIIGAWVAFLVLVGGGVMLARMWLASPDALVDEPKAADEIPGDVVAPPIQPLKLGGQRVIHPLGEVVADAVMGGGGRFIVLHMPKSRRLAIFDVSAGEVVDHVPLADDKVKFAAGLHKLVVYLATEGIIQRYDLLSREREQTEFIAFPGQVHALSMGAASRGPVVASWLRRDQHGMSSGFSLLKLNKLELISTRMSEFWADSTQLRASASGHMFVAWNAGRFMPLFLEGLELRGSASQSAPGFAVPGPDGRMLYTSAGPMPVHGPGLAPPDKGTSASAALPAAHGPYFVTVHPDARRDIHGRELGRAEVRIFVAGEPRPLTALSNCEVVPRGDDRNSLALDKRLFFVPDAKVLALVCPTRDRLELNRVDLDDSLEKSGWDYLVVTSQAPPSAFRGREYVYAIESKAKKGGVRYRLDSGPAGMKVTPEGRLTWRVPGDFKDPSPKVVVGVSDAAKQERLHVFQVAVNVPLAERPLPPLPVPVPAPPRLEERKLPKEEEKIELPVRAPEPVKHIEVALPVEPAPLPIHAPVHDGPSIKIQLPSAADDVVLAGGGRFLVAFLPRLHQAAIIDVSAGKIVKYLQLPNDEAILAAGMNKLIVGLPRSKKLQRWDITSGNREAEADVATTGDIHALAMGAASSGPLLVQTADRRQTFRDSELFFVDAQTLKKIADLPVRSPVPYAAKNTIAASTRGRVFAIVTQSQKTIVEIMGPRVVVNRIDFSLASQTYYLLPGPDERTIFSTRQFSADGKLLPPATAARGGYWPALIPACEGPFFLAVPQGPIIRSDQPARPTVHFFGDQRPIAEVAELPNRLHDSRGNNQPAVSVQHSYYFIPRAKTIAHLSDSGDEVTLHRFDAAEALEESGIDYFYIDSAPPAHALPGQMYSYTVQAKARKGEIKYRLDAGPPGMTIADAGRLTWPVPADFTSGEVTVVISVANGLGREIFHSFRIQPARKSP